MYTIDYLSHTADIRLQLRADSRAEALALVALTERLRAAGVERLLLITVPEAP